MIGLKKIIIKILNTIKIIKLFYNKHVNQLGHDIPRKTYVKNSFDRFYEDEMDDCYKHFKKHFYDASFVPLENIKNFAIKEAVKEFPNYLDENFFFLEFGVWKGASTRNFAKIINPKKIYAFDSFYGLKDHWVGQNNNVEKFNLEGKIPSLGKNVVAIKGWIQDTLDKFILNYLDQEKKIIFIHLDLDTYESTKFVLQKLKKYFTKNTVILFDELYNFSGWKVGEYKALKETLEEDFEYKFFAFSSNGQQAIIKII